MNDERLAYCNKCENLVEFEFVDTEIIEEYKGEELRFGFKIGCCKYCKCEVATDIDYNNRRSKAKIEAYKKKREIISLDEISEILNKYDIGKEALADIAGFGKVTIKRYYEGTIPAKQFSDVLKRILNDEKFFIQSVEENRHKLKNVTYKKIDLRYKRLIEINNSKIDQIVNYIVTHLDEVTPLALEKLLYFSNGVNYALNGKQLIPNECEAWMYGPVYPYIYAKYKAYGYRPIDNGIYSKCGCMLSKVSHEEIEAIDIVIKTFGLFSPKILEMISFSQTPWKEKRESHANNEKCQEVINEKSIEKFYVENDLYTQDKILKYIWGCIQMFQ